MKICSSLFPFSNMKGSVKSISLIPISFCFLFLFRDEFAVPARHLCHPQQREAIRELKNEFQIQKLCFDRTVSWVNNSDCCSWDGIRCDATFGDVIELNLSGNCIYGQLNSKSSILRFQSLPFLATLDLSNNHFSGNVPSSLGNLSKLTTLDLSENAFNGEIPSSLGNLYNLTILNLSQNKLIGKIPPSLGNLPFLHFVLTTWLVKFHTHLQTFLIISPFLVYAKTVFLVKFHHSWEIFHI